MVGSDWLRATLVTSSSFSIWLIICPSRWSSFTSSQMRLCSLPLNWQTENAFDVKRATGKKSADVGHDAGMVGGR